MKLLIIRFSSFGDIVQAIAVPAAFQARYPGAQVDWLTREDFAGLLKSQPSLTNVHVYYRKDGLVGLFRLALSLSREGYTHIYDAHSNLRSTLLVTLLRFLSPRSRFAVRPKDRLRRFAFFKLKLRSSLPRPFRGADSYHRPLVKWGLPATTPPGPQFFLKSPHLPDAVQTELDQLPRPVIAVAASAAWEMKRWPTEHWISLIRLLPDASFFLLGGPGDDFLDEIRRAAPERVISLAGRLSLDQSSATLLQADLVIANDTGVLHVADQMERPTLALIGPTAFGYPSHATSLALERPLECQPCSKDGRGGCQNDVYKRCLVELTPAFVAKAAQDKLAGTAARLRD